MANRKSPPADASVVADVELPGVDGEPVRLGSLWEDGPVVLVWLRHYG